MAMLTGTFTATLPQTVITDRPRVAIVMPYNPKMVPRREGEAHQKALLWTIERDLMNRYAARHALPVIRDIQLAFRNLNSATHRSSVAIFVGDGGTSTLYMDISVEEAFVIDGSFSIKDILDYRLEEREHLVVVLNNQSSRIFLSDATDYRLIQSATAQQADREIFLRRMDEGLSLLLDAYPLPVFVAGPTAVSRDFAAITRHGKNILDYIHVDAPEANDAPWRAALQPYLTRWESLHEKHALCLVEKARETGTLVAGIADVTRRARGLDKGLLVIERNYTGGGHAQPRVDAQNTVSRSYVADPVDQVIWHVLAKGGQVGWVKKDELKLLGHIALVQRH